MATTSDSSAGLTSTTAPGKVFSNRNELAAHYQTQWHQYNLKRRQAGLPMLLEADFEARLAAAQALRQETREAGTDHLKQTKVRKEKKQQKKEKKKDKGNNAGVNMVSQVPAYNRMKEQAEQDRIETEEEQDKTNLDAAPMDTENFTTADAAADAEDDENESAGPEKVEIDPLQSLFDRHMSASVEHNVDRMYRKYGFFVPDREFCSDLEGLVGYLHEKIKLGHMCLYCHRVFTTWQGCQKHMISKQHTKLRYEAGIDLEDLNVFYDFKEENERFMPAHAADGGAMDTVEDGVDDQGDEDGDEWEDISDDEEMDDIEDEKEMDEDDEDAYSEFEEEVARMGLDVTPLGELVFPDGRIVGHRSLRRYYKQRTPRTDERASVQAARTAAGERLYRGRVYQLGGGSATASRNPIEASRAQALALSTAGVAPGLATGRAGRGILVANANNIGSGFTQISVYRFRAVLRKQRREDARGKRLMDRTRQNINRMDKKHNRLMNNVSVAHAAR
uniref:C2H2-type domain-containing protein n=1 Tax=Amphora coffeiformis TaxID=265554 RepID=A0A7S3L7H2_9STRA|eukprot:scaffold3851_cov162-Amphora_coffeaeformis.AAC.10